MVKKIILYAFLSLFLLIGAAISLVYLYQDKIIAMFVAEANKKLATEVKIGKISLSLFEKFPELAIKLDQVQVMGAIKEDTRPLAVAKQLYCTFDFRDLWAGRYVVSRVYLEQADVVIYIDENGKENYQIFKKSEHKLGESTQQDVSFDLKKILLNQVNVRYERGSLKDNAYEVFASDAAASFSTQGGEMDIALEGNLISKQILVDKLNYFKNKSIAIDSKLHFKQSSNELTIHASSLTINRANFTVAGKWQDQKESTIDLAIQSNQTDIQTILSLLPEATVKNLGRYQSKGLVYFSGAVKGNIGRSGIPAIEMKFGCKNASFYHPDFKKGVQGVNLTGVYSNGKKHELSTTSLRLNNINGMLDGRKFSGDFALTNFKNPFLAFNVQGDVAVGSLLAFYPIEKIQQASGELQLQLSFEGKISDLKAERLTQYVRTSGDITVKDLDFKLRGVDIRFQDFNGNFQFRKSDLMVNSFSGKAGNSDFMLNGFFRNIMAYVLIKDQDLGVQANFKSHVLDIDELLTPQNSNSSASQPTSLAVNTPSSSAEPYRFTLSHRLDLALTCEIDQIKFRRFKAQQVFGNLDLDNQVARISNLSLQTAGGNIRVDGKVDTRTHNRVEVEVLADFGGIPIDQIFYMFENFQQTFIQDKNLKGKLSSQVQAYMVFDEQLNMITPLLKADIQASVLDGELNQFSPMQKMSFFLRRRELANIRFSELRNNIHIENRTVHIPKMDIKSSISNIAISGTHTFDQVMDYHLVFPISNLARPDKDAKFGTIEENTDEAGNLFLALKGTSDNFKVAYDVRSASRKMKKDLRGEKREWKDRFKRDPAERESNQKKLDKSDPQKPEKEEEYFDF